MKRIVKANEPFLFRSEHVGINRVLTVTQEEYDRIKEAVDVIKELPEVKKPVVKEKPIMKKVEVKVLEIKEKPIVIKEPEIEYVVEEKETGKKIANLRMKGNKIKFKSINYDKEVSKTIRKYQMKRSSDLGSLIKELGEKGYDVN